MEFPGVGAGRPAQSVRATARTGSILDWAPEVSPAKLPRQFLDAPVHCQLSGPPRVDVRSGPPAEPAPDPPADPPADPAGPGRLAVALDVLQGWLLPPRCVLCLDPGQPPTLDLCADCQADFPLNGSACPRCAEPPAGCAPPDPSATPLAAACAPLVVTPCARCLDAPPPFTSALVPYRYAWPLDAVIRRLKYGRQWSHARVLGHLLAQHAADVAHARVRPLPQLLIPVPLHPERERLRGANQAFEIARVAGRRLGVRVDPLACVRLRDTPAQARLGADERRHNLDAAFAVRRLRGARHVALVDDVMTTGSTLAALARAVLAAGATHVEAWAVARASYRNPA
jgi:ComF family protein